MVEKAKNLGLGDLGSNPHSRTSKLRDPEPLFPHLGNGAHDDGNSNNIKKYLLSLLGLLRRSKQIKMYLDVAKCYCYWREKSKKNV